MKITKPVASELISRLLQGYGSTVIAPVISVVDSMNHFGEKQQRIHIDK